VEGCRLTARCTYNAAKGLLYSWNNGGLYTYNVTFAVTQQATNVSFHNVGTDNAVIAWTNGNGSQRAVFVRGRRAGL